MSPRLALWQGPSPAGDVGAGLAALETALAAAKAAGADLVVFPELFLPGYNAVVAEAPDAWRALPAQVAERAERMGQGLVIGLPEYADGAVYNAAFAFDAAGRELARYRKIQLFGPREAGLFSAGDRLVWFDHQDTRYGLLICYDVEFPEHVRALARAGADVILNPTANMQPYSYVNRILVPARAAENAVSVVYANYCGREGDLSYVAESLIAGPDGRPLALAGQTPALLVADLPAEGQPLSAPLSTQLADYRAALPGRSEP